MATTRVIGLDIGSSCVRAAELEFGSGGPAGQDAARRSCGSARSPCRSAPSATARSSQPETVSSALRQLWAQAKFESKDVVIGVGNQRVIVRELDLPWMPLAQLQGVPAVPGERAAADVDRRRPARLLPDGRVRRTPGPHGPRHARRGAAGHRQRERHRGRGRRPAARGWSTSTRSPCTGRSPAASSPSARPRSSTSARRSPPSSSPRRVAPRSCARCPRAARTSPTPSRARWASPRPRPRPSSARSASATPSAPSARTPPRRSARSSARSSSRSATRSSTTRATTRAPASTSSSSPAAARTFPASGSTCRARAGCRSRSATRSPASGPRKTVQRDALNGHESFIALPVGLAYGVAA